MEHSEPPSPKRTEAIHYADLRILWSTRNTRKGAFPRWQLRAEVEDGNGVGAHCQPVVMIKMSETKCSFLINHVDDYGYGFQMYPESETNSVAEATLHLLSEGKWPVTLEYWYTNGRDQRDMINVDTEEAEEIMHSLVRAWAHRGPRRVRSPARLPDAVHATQMSDEELLGTT